MRLKVAITSSALKSEPSCHLTPLRSLISQVVGSTAFHDSASPGCRRCTSSIFTSVSNTCLAMALLGPRLWKWGSREVTGVDKPITRSCWAAAPRLAETRSAASRPRRCIAGMGESSVVTLSHANANPMPDLLRCIAPLRCVLPTQATALRAIALTRFRPTHRGGAPNPRFARSPSGGKTARGAPPPGGRGAPVLPARLDRAGRHTAPARLG